jgi:xanthine dehydrogenase YagR molybdenum-binding subunit
MSAVIGDGGDRVDGPAKVCGAAPYPTDITYPHLAHAALVRSTIASGRVIGINDAEARAAAGVLTVITHETVPKFTPAPFGLLGPAPPPPLQGNTIHHHGQYVAVVVADTAHQAAAGARVIRLDYERGEAPLLEFDDPRSELEATPWDTATRRGDVDAGLAHATALHEATYTTADNTNNPLGLFATVAAWEGDTVTVHDATQWPAYAQATIAGVFGIDPTAVRVRAPYVGGAFGAGLFVWQHVILAVLAARVVGRPVKLVLSRPQMFTSVGHRPSSVQTMRIGARRDGELVAIEHVSINSAAIEHSSIEPISGATARSYACANVATTDRQRRLNIAFPGSMRGPGHAQGNFALESAIDELAYELGLDPLHLRLRNYAAVHPQSGLPWSSNALRECYAVGAERFGWSNRDPEIGSMRDGHWKIGYGLAAISWSWWQVRCQARATITRDGHADVRSAASDPGTGTRTVMRQLAAERLGLPLDDVRFELGDSDMPWSPASGGSSLTASLGNAVHAACEALVQRFLDVVAEDDGSPLRGCSIDDVFVAKGRVQRRTDPSSGERYADILGRHELNELTAEAEATPPSQENAQLARSGPFAAKFVEVRVDEDLGVIRVTRVTSVVDAGRILHEKTAQSQIVGGTIGGIGQALFEETVTDPGTGRIVNATFGDYLIPVNADVPDIDVVFVGEPDPLTPLGAKGLGEIGLVGIAAAVANGVHHATGRRIRSIPITLDKLL